MNGDRGEQAVLARSFAVAFAFGKRLGKGEGARQIASGDEEVDGGLDDRSVLRLVVIDPKPSQQRIDPLLRLCRVLLATARVDVQEAHFGAHAVERRLVVREQAFVDFVEQDFVSASVSVVELRFQHPFDIARRERGQP